MKYVVGYLLIAIVGNKVIDAIPVIGWPMENTPVEILKFMLPGLEEPIRLLLLTLLVALIEYRRNIF